ncbi:hypothetical protein DPEC_G00336710 [Dallia pectoralis]|uniref:Uncharacterized protein n=1 Tax=Dallia pectoralis TaxID=75939 RepID=A0ACC2F7I1_DALPE|nr:hypothetical protein DPEC_G00336710 [Dallia pectoralis]
MRGVRRSSGAKDPGLAIDILSTSHCNLETRAGLMPQSTLLAWVSDPWGAELGLEGGLLDGLPERQGTQEDLLSNL